ncbi:type II 3-dehydroquinate dehydratase [Lancefieldella parvula]|uniref:type II 3-dehydroquinate dehydratase n=1 Tax=Lancefieldella parvula TaxID=1382 RepID=UPI0028D154EA|nr:type II 3-dehydroquinate dehydratase [Lancefieldella parvula]
MDSNAIAYEILNAIGGSKNLIHNEVCMTRLRLSISDMTLIDYEQLSTATGVLGIVGKGANGLEVVFGPNLVNQVNNSLDQILEEPEVTSCSLNEKHSASLPTHNEEVDELISLLAQKNTIDQNKEDFDSLASDLDTDDFEDNYEDDLEAPRLLIINGPNINMLGIREPEIYGKADYRTLIEACKTEAQSQGFSECVCYQSNHEGDLIDAIQDALGSYDGIIINPAAYTHTSVALLDTALAVQLPMIEVHLTDISTREDFRHISYIKDACFATVAGKGIDSYREAIQLMATYLRAEA